MKYFIWTIIVLVVAAVMAGFFVVGSPQQERLRRFDERRVSDLQVIQSEIINYWIRKEKLPDNTDQLRDDIRGFAAPKDSQTGDAYIYRVQDKQNLIFELCAVFVASNLDDWNNINAPKAPYPYPYGLYDIQQNWQHDKGLVCFERKIDPELYKPRIKE